MTGEIKEALEEIKDAKVDISHLPVVNCPHCGARASGWSLKADIGKVIRCDKCHGKMRLL
jgi:hypothetical protein